jgi:iron complex outermembrane receptor protein
MRTSRIAAIILAVGLVLVPPIAAQSADSGRVQVVVQEAMGMLSGFRVQSSGTIALTDAAGRAVLKLAPGRQVVTVAHVGFKPAQATVIIVRDSTVTLRFTMAMNEMAMELADVKISATRTERLAGETPIRVEVVDEMEVDEKTLMSPSGIGMLLNETPGLRVQATAPGLGTGSVRILGLPGNYTVMLADGLPLYGGSSSALGPLDISPVDLQRVEIIKGAASSLYGAQALGGVINLVSKPPTGKNEILLNRRTLGVTDAATWLSRRFGTGTGLSLLAAGTVQSPVDVDRDGWADQSKTERWNVRPRFTAVDARGRSLFVTAGYGYDNRVGGTLNGAVAPDGLPFREALQSRRADVGATARVPLQGSGSLSLRFAYANSSRRRDFGPGESENDGTSTGLLELTRSFESGTHITVVGSALQLDDYSNALNSVFDHRWYTPGLFATTERDAGPVTISASARADAHPDAGVQVTERLAVLTKPAEGWSVRASVGTGFAAASATTEETEATGLRSIRSGGSLRPEKSVSATLDVNGELAGAELLVTLYGSQIAAVVHMAELPGFVGVATLRNANVDTRIGGVEALAVWRFSGGKFIATYGYANGSRPDAITSLREAMPMLPRHRVGADLMLEKPGVYRMGLEGTWYGEQALDDDPYRTMSKPYLYAMAIAARQFGSLEVVVNFENLLNVRQTDTDPLLRRTRGMAGRWTTDAWAPLEGFMANVALRYRWQ